MTTHISEDFDARIGTGVGLINPNSKDLSAVKQAIQDHYSTLGEEEKMMIRLRGLRYKMESFTLGLSMEENLSAGGILKEFIHAIGVRQKVFAGYIGLKTTNLSAIINGTRRINHDLAFKLGSIFAMDPALWMNVQNKAELVAMKKQKPDDHHFTLSELLKQAR